MKQNGRGVDLLKRYFLIKDQEFNYGISKSNSWTKGTHSEAQPPLGDRIDSLLTQAGWIIQPKNKINLDAGLGVAVREYQTDAGPADYVLFVERQPISIIEAKREEEGHRLTIVEE